MKRFAVLGWLVLMTGATPAQDLVPFKMDLPKTCSYQNLKLPADAIVLAAGGYEGKRLDFQIDQSGHEATQIDVAVNSPTKPVILMLGAYEPTIWNIGWSSRTRIVAVLAVGNHAQRVAGVEARTPVLTSSREDSGPCNPSGYFSGNKISEGERALSQKLFLRDISDLYEVVDGKVVVGSPLSVTQKLVTSAHTPPASFHRKDLPLAGQAGLKQAEQDGVLRRATIQDIEQWNADLRAKRANSGSSLPDIDGSSLFNGWVVMKDFVCPAGLYGANSANFFVASGVSPPTGQCGHSRVYDRSSMTLGCTADSPCGQVLMRN